MTDLRKHFFKEMEKLAKKDKDVIVLVGDLGYSFCEEYAEKYPDQFINVGAIEQAMVGIASGLALQGKKPYCYSGAIFLVMRAYEFIRDDVAYANANVKLIGTGASGFLGFTHNMTNGENEEDLLKNLPNLKRHYPQSEDELSTVLENSYKLNQPSYVRL